MPENSVLSKDGLKYYDEKSKERLSAELDKKVDKVAGKELSTNDFTNDLKTKLGIAYEHSQTSHARTDATKTEKSNTNGNIKINDTETNVYTHPDTHSIAEISGLQATLDKKGTYNKPSDGIPKSDLASAVQESLGKADTALQNYTEKYTGTITEIKMNGVSKGTSGVVDLGTVLTGGKQTTTSTADGGSNIYTFSDGTTLTVQNGSKGSSGTNGTNGSNGVSCTHSWNGTTLTITSASGTSSANLKGKDGTNGASATWFTGTAVTGTSTTAVSVSVSGSKAGDMYLNVSTANVYRASAANSWVYVCNIKGATGAKGDNGTNGTNGKDGVTPTIKAAAGSNIGSVGTPSVTASTNGTTTTFTFNNLKGATGATGTRGTVLSLGTAITGTSTTATIFSGSGLASSLVNDVYLNTSTFNMYKCTVAGNAATAKWVYIGCIKGTNGTNATTTAIGNASTAGLTKLYTSTGTATDGTMTQAAIKTALDGKANLSHTHNYAGSSSAGGVATSANKLENKRTVSGGTDITMSFNYDGSADSSANIGYYNCYARKRNTNNYPYHRFAKLDEITTAYTDKTMTIYISQDFNGGSWGIARLSLRTNNSPAVSSAEVKWLARVGFPADAIQIGIYNVYGKTYADAFLKPGSAYGSTVIRAIANGSRGNISRTWTLINSQEVDNTTTSDAKTSVECYVDIATAATKLHAQAYSAIINGIDDGTVKYANSAGSASSANVATALSSSAGSAVQPVYFKDGKPVAGTYTLEKSVPSNAKFTDTTYTLAGLMGSSAKGSTTQPVYWTGSAWANTTYTLGKSVPSNAVFTDTNTTYSAGTGLTLSGTQFNLYIPRVTKDSRSIPGTNRVIFEEYSEGSSYNLPSNAWYHIITMEGSDNKYATQLALGMTVNGAYYRKYDNSTWGSWNSLINTDTTYSDATTSAHGLMSAADKKKLDGIASGANKTVIDSELSSTSTNPVQNKVLNSELASYLKLSGGIVTGIVSFKQGQKVAAFTGTSGTAGYALIAVIKISSTYQNEPIELTFSRRSDACVTRLSIGFSSTNSKDPSLSNFKAFGATCDCWMYKSDTSTWNLYIKKTEGYDSIGVVSLYHPEYAKGISITWGSGQVSSIPSGAIQASYGYSVGSATKVNGHTVNSDVPANAKFTDTVYTHPTSSGNKHIPSGGSSGQILRWSADGTAVWGADNNTTYNDVTQTTHGLMTAADKKKLDGISSGARVGSKTAYQTSEPSNQAVNDSWLQEY